MSYYTACDYVIGSIIIIRLAELVNLYFIEMYLVKKSHAYLLLLQSHWEKGLLQQFIVFQVLHTLDTQVVPRNTAQVLLVAPHQLEVRHTKMILLFTFIILVLILLYPQCRCFNCPRTFPKAIYGIQIKKILISTRLFQR